ncbi:VMAP-C domain-containing protein [Streptomyces sp. NPDC001492]
MLELQRSMTERLTRHPALSSQAGTRALLRRLARHPDAVPHLVDLLAPSTGQLEHLLQLCSDRPERADALADALDYITGEPETALPLRTLADRLAALKWLEDSELSDLQGHLLPVPAINLHAIAQACLPPLAADLPRHCTAAWPTVLHLLRRNVLPNGLPPFMAFLEYLAATNSAQCDALQTWTQRRAEQWDLLDALLACRAEAKGYRLPQPEPGRVMFVFLPDGLQDDYYTLRMWHREGATRAIPALRDEDTQAVGQRDLARTVCHRLHQWIRDAGTAARNLTIEFWLPVSLVNQPVWEWCQDVDEPITPQWHVVIRSLDRLQSPTIQRAWHSRWNNLMSEPTTSMPRPATELVHDPDTPQPPDSDLVILRHPPDEQPGRVQFLDALRRGAPVILWHRHDCSDAFLTTARQLIAEGPLSELPSRISALRAGTLPPGAAGDGLRDITLLWDDPDNTLPPLRQLVAPSEATAP